MTNVMPRKQRVARIMAALIDSNGGRARPAQIEKVVEAAGYNASEARAAFESMHLVAVTDPRGHVYWARRRNGVSPWERQ